MKRIAVIGNGGGGKSTLCLALGKRLGIPVHEVDTIQYLPGWRHAPLDETVRILDGWTAAETWMDRKAAVRVTGPRPRVGRANAERRRSSSCS